MRARLSARATLDYRDELTGAGFFTSRIQRSADLRMRHLFRSSPSGLKTNRSQAGALDGSRLLSLRTSQSYGGRGAKNELSSAGPSAILLSPGCFRRVARQLLHFLATERPQSYRILKKLHKIEPATKRLN